MQLMTRAQTTTPGSRRPPRWGRGSVTIGAAALALSLAALAAGPADAATHTAVPGAAAVKVEVKTVAKYGKILVDQKGLPLYYDSKNTSGHWACTGACLTAWPPLLLPAGQMAPNMGAGVKGLGTVKAPYGTQVTWHGKALYTFIKDSAGKVTGNDAGNFFVASLPKAGSGSGSGGVAF